MDIKAISRIVARMQAPINRCDKEMWQIEKAAEMGYMMALSELGIFKRKTW